VVPRTVEGGSGLVGPTRRKDLSEIHLRRIAPDLEGTIRIAAAGELKYNRMPVLNYSMGCARSPEAE